MATWIRQGTGTAPSATDADLVGSYALDNATAPGDFDPAAITSVRTQWTITGSGFSDDSWNNVAGCAVDTGGTEISQHPGEGSTLNKNVARSTDHTDSTGIPTGLSTAQWEAAVVRGNGTLIPNEWSQWNKSKGPDGATMAVSALTVTITYTPASGGTNYNETGRSTTITSTVAVADQLDATDTALATTITATTTVTDAIGGTFSEVQTASNTSTGTDLPTTIVVTLGTAATAGNLLVGTLFQRPSTKPPVHADWDGELWAVEDTTNADWLISYYKVAVGGETTMTFETEGGGSTDLNVATVVEYDGFTGTPTLDKTATNGPVDATSVSTGTTATLANATSLAIAGFSMRTTGSLTSTFNTYTNGFTESIEASNSNGTTSAISYTATAWVETSATTGQETTVTVSDSGRLMGGVATFYDGSAGTNYNETGKTISVTSTIASSDQFNAIDTSLAITGSSTVSASDIASFLDTLNNTTITSTTSMSDVLAFNELNLATTITATINSTDAGSFVDSLSTVVTSTANLTDIMAGLDALSITIAGTTVVTDTFSGGSTNYNETGRAVTITATVTSADQLNMTETLASTASITVTLADMLAAVDTLSTSIAGTTVVNDVSDMVETLLANTVASTVTASDSYTMNELLEMVATMTVGLIDQASLTDTLATNIVSFVNSSDFYDDGAPKILFKQKLWRSDRTRTRVKRTNNAII